jgi:hypothetical protein
MIKVIYKRPLHLRVFLEYKNPTIKSGRIGISWMSGRHDHYWPLALSDYKEDFDTWDLEVMANFFWIWTGFNLRWIKKGHPSVYLNK